VDRITTISDVSSKQTTTDVWPSSTYFV